MTPDIRLMFYLCPACSTVRGELGISDEPLTFHCPVCNSPQRFKPLTLFDGRTGAKTIVVMPDDV